MLAIYPRQDAPPSALLRGVGMTGIGYTGADGEDAEPPAVRRQCLMLLDYSPPYLVHRHHSLHTHST